MLSLSFFEFSVGIGAFVIGPSHISSFLCCLRSIAAHRDHYVRRLSDRPSARVCVCVSVCLSGSHTFLVVTHSYVSQATHAFLGMLPLCLSYININMSFLNVLLV